MLWIKELKKVHPEQLLHRFRAARFRGAGGELPDGFPSFFLFTPFHSFAMTQPLPDPRSSLSHFTAQEVQHYDSRIPSLVPGYAVLHYGGAALLGQWLPDGARVLAVGAGTGADLLALHQMARQVGKSWRYTAVEPMPEMLALARQKCLAAGVPQIDWHGGFLGSAPQAPHDGAVCHLVMHFIESLEGKRQLLEGIARRLKPGAPLLLSDLIAAQPDEREALIECVTALGLPAEKAQVMRSRLQQDFFPLTLDAFAALAGGCGFTPPSLFFRVPDFAGWALRRA